MVIGVEISQHAPETAGAIAGAISMIGGPQRWEYCPTRKVVWGRIHHTSLSVSPETAVARLAIAALTAGTCRVEISAIDCTTMYTYRAEYSEITKNLRQLADGG